MKKLFLAILGILIVASIYTWMTRASHQKEVPVIYWKSDANPQRYEQIELFHKWLVKKGHVTPTGKPAAELRLDPSDARSSMIHAVSGVGGDLIETNTVRFYEAMGVTDDLTPYAKQGKYDIAHTYKGLAGILDVNGKQRAYITNGAVGNFWCNLDTFKKYDMPEPPEEWTPEEFEAFGKEFVARANKDNPKNRVFFGQSILTSMTMVQCISRSKGYDFYNETLTRSTINNPEVVKAFKLLYKWTYEDRLFPTAAEVASANVQSGYGGANFSQFMSQQYAIIQTGRYALIRFREFATPLNVKSVQLPMYEFKNLLISARQITVYAGSKNKQLARWFLEFLADKDYNDYIIEHADGLPPNPEFAIGNPKYLAPRPNEGNVHAAELKWALEIALPNASSPYFNLMGTDWSSYSLNKYTNNLCSAEEAAQEAEARYNASIADSIEANPELKAQWEKDTEDQVKINELKEKGLKIPAKLIKNPFYLAYYRAKGMLEE